jgi:hypothetical protein
MSLAGIFVPFVVVVVVVVIKFQSLRSSGWMKEHEKHNMEAASESDNGA